MSGAITPSERLLVVVGPSGAGKDSVLTAWAALLGPGERVHLARRTITRPADGGAERHEAVDSETFATLLRQGAFATAWDAHGLRYGVRHRELAPLADGWVVLNSSRAHLPTLRRQAPRLHVVEITAPAEVLARRLAGRGREDAAEMAERLQRHVPEAHADLTLVNDATLDAVAARLDRWWRDLLDAPPDRARIGNG
jgi:phosphonate metabolism protein PhnN/1,5-bisphosphokinase (PRPP-forming)